MSVNVKTETESGNTFFLPIYSACLGYNVVVRTGLHVLTVSTLPLLINANGIV